MLKEFAAEKRQVTGRPVLALEARVSRWSPRRAEAAAVAVCAVVSTNQEPALPLPLPCLMLVSDRRCLGLGLSVSLVRDLSGRGRLRPVPRGRDEAAADVPPPSGAGVTR